MFTICIQERVENLKWQGSFAAGANRDMFLFAWVWSLSYDYDKGEGSMVLDSC